MKIVFLSNFYNHHQSYISRKLYELTNGQYRFIETSKVTKERLNLGYGEDKDCFVLFYDDSVEECQQWIDSADIVIVGSSMKRLLHKRKKQNKIIFKYSERPLKNGFEIWKYPIRWLRWHIENPPNKPIYMLCASGYAASDYAKFGMYKNKTYKWGYFPECRIYEKIDNLLQNKKCNEILWCGRFLDWKHPDDVVTIAEWLKKDNYKFHISIIGTGEMEEVLNKRILELNLTDRVSMLGTMTPTQVREYMETTGIYLFTSDRKEGWGAVLNEAMNSGCAVVASNEIGSVPYLIKNGENGLIYKSGDIKDLYEKVKLLLDSSDMQKQLGRLAYNKIIKEWNYEIAAERLLHLFEIMLTDNKYDNTYIDGPCSKA